MVYNTQLPHHITSHKHAHFGTYSLLYQHAEGYVVGRHNVVGPFPTRTQAFRERAKLKKQFGYDGTS